MRPLNVLELFAGSRSFGKVCEASGHNVFSVDWSQEFPGIHLRMDIGKLAATDIPFVPDVVWASPDCTSYSIAAISTHRSGTYPKSNYAKLCDAVNTHVLQLIKDWSIQNPSLVYFVENPRGMLRKMHFMKDIPRRETVWYCQYGDDRAKPTDIFTNSVLWTPRPVCRNGSPSCHHQRAPRGAKTGTQGRNGSFERSKIPPQLCQEIVAVCERHYGLDQTIKEVMYEVT